MALIKDLNKEYIPPTMSIDMDKFRQDEKEKNDNFINDIFGGGNDQYVIASPDTKIEAFTIIPNQVREEINSSQSSSEDVFEEPPVV